MMKFIIALLLSSACQAATFSYLKVGDSSTIAPSAALEIKSTTAALLLPRMTTTQKNAIVSPIPGDMVYDLTLGSFSVYSGGVWNVVPTGAIAWGNISGTLSSQTDLQSALNLKAPIASPTFTGVVTSPSFVGPLTGNASTSTSSSTSSITDDTSTNATMFPTWVTTASSNQSIKTSSSKFTFNPSSGFVSQFGLGLKQITTPSNPPSGYDNLYFKSDNQLYSLDSSGNENQIGSGGSGSGSGINVLTNPGFENGITVGWANTGGTFAAVNSGSNLLIGNGSATFTASSSGQFVNSSLYAVPNGLKGTSCSASMLYTGASSNLTFEAVDGSANVLASTVLSSQTLPTVIPLTFVCPSSGTFGIRVTSTASSALIAMDQMFLGSNTLLNISQGQWIGSAYWPTTASCIWSQTGTSSLSNFSAVSACPVPTVSGQVAYSGVKTPSITLPSIQPGTYYFVAHGTFEQVGGNTANHGFRFSDGTNNSPPESITGGVAFNTWGDISGIIKYSSSQGSTTINIQGVSGGSDSIIIDVSTPTVVNLGDFQIDVFFQPSISQLALRPDMVANSWTGAHGPTCMWSTSSTSYADLPFTTTCTFTQYQNANFGTVVSQNDGNVLHFLPGIVFTPSRPGTYFVCATPAIEMQAADINVYAELTDGANNVIANTGYLAIGPSNSGQTGQPICGNYTATSISPVTFKIRAAASSTGMNVGVGSTLTDAIGWTIHQIDQQIPAPLLVGSVVSSSLGVEHIERARLTSECSSDPCPYVGTPGITAINWMSTGQYIIHFASNVFSDIPVCVAIPVFVTGTSTGVTNDNVVNTSTTFGIATISFGATATLVNSMWNVICTGPH